MTQATFDPELAEVRFGTGLSSYHAPPAGIAGMLASMRGPDRIAAAIPIQRFAEAEPRVSDLRQLRRERNAMTGAAGAAAQERLEVAQRAARAAEERQLAATIARGVATTDGLRERLALFWADHFAVAARTSFARHMVEPYVEEAIRPHLTGPFEVMLIAAATHPMMLEYLDQSQSVGPSSAFGLRSGRGLNENLARELLELHTVGPGGPYDQRDVHELAELLTGLLGNQEDVAEYRPAWAEPGSETVLGRTYPAAARLESVHEVLRALARHRATAAHLSRKLAVHFVADDPDPALVGDLAAVWRDTGGDLAVVTEALLTHAAAWRPERRKVRRPVEFVIAGLRALGVPAAALTALDRRGVVGHIRRPLAMMGQSWTRPDGPDGFPEAAEAWVTAQGLAGRIDWAMRSPGALLSGDLPDPREFAVTALGKALSSDVAFAASAAESRAEGVGLVLASAAFQWR